jgi:general secretion pathway protein B
MSYILDALKKAEAERKLGAVPGIHAPTTYAGGTDHRSGRKLWLWGALATLAAMLAALAWFQPWHAPETPALPRMPEPAQVAAARQPPVQPLPSQATGPAPVAVQAPMSVKPSVQARLAEPAKAKAVVRIVPPALPGEQPPAASRAPKLALKLDTGLGDGQQDNEPLTLRELPEQIQREIPALKIGGYIYSNNPAERSLLINNKLLREGDEVAPGLTLEKMMRGSVVLVYKGTRYRMMY